MDGYLAKIDTIRKSQLDIEEKIQQLDTLYNIKPVRLPWYVAKAELFWEKKLFGEVNKCLRGKFIDTHFYEGTIENLAIWEQLDKRANDISMVEYRGVLKAFLQGNKEVIHEQSQNILELEEKYLNQEITSVELAEKYIACAKWVSAYIMILYMEQVEKSNPRKRKWLSSQINYGYLKECIALHKKVVICIDEPVFQMEAYVLGKCLAELGCPIYVISIPVQIEVDSPVLLAETVAVSDENATSMYGFVHLPAIELIYEGRSLGDNCAHLINAICEEDETILVLASSPKFEELSHTTVLKNRIDNLSGYQEGLRTSHYAFGWCGSYLDYIGQLYSMDVKAMLDREPECRFSIVIPVRNSAATLQYTLQSCLNQRFQGDYEIVISDNSTEENVEVYQYVQTLNDNRIRYYRTPRDLRLSRSFEYAFLQTRGEYVLSIGADDAVLPWTLEVWNQVIEQFPNEEVFAWDRGFYAWPGFNGGQQHQFIIPGKYEKEQYSARYEEPIYYLKRVLEQPSIMYALPMLYINSGFKRSYIKTILKKTGRLWDGICQDIYMGVIVASIKDKIVRMQYPLTIAGMSNASVGAQANFPMQDHKKAELAVARVLQEDNIGGFSRSKVECLMPDIGSDRSSLYNSVLRAMNRGLMPARYLKELFNWKQWFLNCYEIMSKNDIYYERKIQQMRFAAMKQGEEFLKWFDETIYQDAMKPMVFPKIDYTVKLYKEMDNENGKIVDASRYGVQNVYEASLLFEKLSNL